MPPPAPTFAVIDWLVLGGYLAVVLLIGLAVSRRKTEGDDFFLAGRRIPMWAAAISVLATAQSAATFIGGPAEAYASNLTYLSANLGALLGIVIVAFFFIPAYYRHNVTSIYEVVGHSLGSPAQRAASLMFLIGRIFASGARLFIVAIPFSLVAFGHSEPRVLLLSIAVIAAGSTAYTMYGGIRAVIWTDVLQAVVYIGTVAVALVLLWQRIPAGASDVVAALSESDGGSKLTLFDSGFRTGADGETTFDFTAPYSLPAILLGLTLFNLAAFGTDQDLAQRMLTCRNAKSGMWSAILSNVIGWPVIFIFLGIGLLLWVFFNRADLMGAAAPGYEPASAARAFLDFILHEMPPGVRGLMMAGLFAAAMSSLDSAVNAMSSAFIADFYRPARAKRMGSAPDAAAERRISRWAVVAAALLLAGFAAACVFWQEKSGETLITFALGVMVFAYSGLLAVFLTALFTKRGNALSAVAALATGFLCVLFTRSDVLQWLTGRDDVGLAFGWQMLLGTTISFIVCCLGRRQFMHRRGSAVI